MSPRRMRRRLAVVALLALALAAGCSLQVDDYKQVSLDGEVTYNGSGFAADGEVALEGNPDAAPYEDLRLYLLGADGTVLRAVALPPVFDGTEVSVSAEQRPAYVIVSGPSLWADDEQTFVEYHAWDAEAEAYVTRSADGPQAFPVALPDT